jgi:isoquinoline 1-oxidoreductase beta subunit
VLSFSRTPRASGQEGYTLSRRNFLIATIEGSIVLGYARSALAAAEFPLDARRTTTAGDLFEPTIWYSIGRDGRITVNIIRAEMGQHVGTALARIIADELEVDWDKVAIVHVDTDPKWGEMVTGGSWSVWQSFPLLSRAGAAGRIALIEEGAKLLGVDRGMCKAQGGAVICGSQSIAYGDIVTRGNLNRTYTPDELEHMPIKPAAERLLIDSSAKTVAGYIKSLALDDPSGTAPGWVMVYAESFMAASRAADLVKVKWSTPEAAHVSEQDLQRRATQLIDDKSGGALVVDDPGVDAAFAAAKQTLEQTYTTSTVMHFALEPINGLAFEKDGVFEVHTGNQWQTLTLPWLAKALGRSPDKIVMRTYLLGGGFGRRLGGDYAVPVALAAKAVGRPVKMVATRADDMRFDCPRSPSVQRLRMAFGDGGKVTAMEHHAAAGWPTAVYAPAFMLKDKHGVEFDPFAIHGADHWYTVGAQRLRALRNDLANQTFRPGWLRSVGSGWVNWALESFMDEAAHTAQSDPVTFRLRMLDGAGRNAGSAPNAVGGARRQAAVLARVAEKAAWGGTMPKDAGLGVATTFGQERDMPTWVACVARVRVDRASGGVFVETLTLVVDAGTIVHPDGAKAQVEGAALWGLSMALHEGSEFVNGLPRDTNLDTYTPLRMGDVPEIEVELMPSDEAPVGLGEPATTVVAPAIGNAIFAASGARLRHLPIRPDAVLRALNTKS